MTRRRPAIANLENFYRGLRGLPALRPPTRRIVGAGGIPPAEAFGTPTVALAGVSHGHSGTWGDLFGKRGDSTTQRVPSGTASLSHSEAYRAGAAIRRIPDAVRTGLHGELVDDATIFGTGALVAGFLAPIMGLHGADWAMYGAAVAYLYFGRKRAKTVVSTMA